MQNIVLTVTYDGTAFLGWQKTKMGPSIEEELEKAIFQVLQKKIKLQAASRTDRGVHACFQIVNFFVDAELDLNSLQLSLNRLLPKAISIKKIEIKLADFHPTLDATSKEYHYFISNTAFQMPQQRHFAWHVPYFLDIQIMEKAAQKLIGKHDFATFENTHPNKREKNTIKTILDISISSLDNHLLKIAIRGDHFLYKMVRNIVGTLVYIGAQKIPLDNLSNILKSKNRKKAAITAPAHGLFLYKVYY